MKKRINEHVGIVTLSLVLLAGAIAYADNNSDGKPVAVSSSSSGPSINQGAGTANSQNGSAGAVSKVIGVANIGLGAVKMSQFATSCAASLGGGCQYSLLFQGILHFAMGAQSFQQAKQHAGAEYATAMTGLDTSAWNNPFGNPNVPGIQNLLDPTVDTTKDKTLATAVNLGKFNEIKSALLSSGINGVRIDPKSGKIIDSNTGKTYDPAKLTDAASMAQAGFSGSDISAAMDSAAKIEKAALKKLGLTEGIGAATAENGYTEGGSAGVTSGSISGALQDSTSSDGSRRGIASSGGAGIKIPSNQIAGLTKNFNGERIGVPAENIFNMMARRYKTKEKQNSFFDPSEMVKMPQ